MRSTWYVQYEPKTGHHGQGPKICLNFITSLACIHCSTPEGRGPSAPSLLKSCLRWRRAHLAAVPLKTGQGMSGSCSVHVRQLQVSVNMFEHPSDWTNQPASPKVFNFGLLWANAYNPGIGWTNAMIWHTSFVFQRSTRYCTCMYMS